MKKMFIFLVCFTSMAMAASVMSQSLSITARKKDDKGNPAAPKPGTGSAREVRFDSEDSYTFSEGFCALKKNEMWGFIDSLGTVVIPFEYFKWGNAQPFFSSGIAILAMKQGYGNVITFLDKKGQQLFRSQKYSNSTPFYSGLAIAEKINETSRARTYQIIGRQGTILPGSINPGSGRGLSHTLDPFSEGVTRLYDSKAQAIGFINTQGKWVIPPKDYGNAGCFGDGLVAVQNKVNYYWGYIDMKGQVKIPFDYKNEPGVFSEGMAMVKNSSDLIGYIDKNGKRVLECKYLDQCFPFKNGYAVVYTKDDPAGYAIIDRAGNYIRRMGPDPVQVFENGWIYYKSWVNSMWAIGVLSPEGNDLLIPGYFAYIGKFSNGLAYAVARVDGKEVSGFINKQFNFVILQVKD